MFMRRSIWACGLLALISVVPLSAGGATDFLVGRRR